MYLEQHFISVTLPLRTNNSITYKSESHQEPDYSDYVEHLTTPGRDNITHSVHILNPFIVHNITNYRPPLK